MPRTAAADLGQIPLAPDVPMGYGARLRAMREFHTGIVAIGRAGGPVTMVRLGPAWLVPTFAVVTSPQGAHDVLAGAHGALDKEMVVHVQQRALGDNVFNLRDERWTPRRRTLQPLFTKKHVSGYAGHMAAAAEVLVEEAAGKGTIDLDDEMRRLTLRVVGKSVFGLDLGDRAYDLGPDVRRVLTWVTNRALRPVRAPIWLPTPARWRMRRSMAALHAVIDRAVDAARQGQDDNAELVRLLLEATDPETGKALTPDAIRAELLVFLLAGHDTTATTLTYGLWALGRDQEMQDRVAAEVAALGERTLTVEDVAELPYTVQVVHEALRLCPPAPALGRMAMQDVVVDGFLVPKGTNVVVGIYGLQRDPDLWTDPERFDPDRFTHDLAAGRDRWQYLPFGGGPRSCIGDHFAMLEATLGLATVVRGLQIEALEPEFPVALPFTMTAGGVIPARVRRR